MSDSSEEIIIKNKNLNKFKILIENKALVASSMSGFGTDESLKEAQ